MPDKKLRIRRTRIRLGLRSIGKKVVEKEDYFLPHHAVEYYTQSNEHSESRVQLTSDY